MAEHTITIAESTYQDLSAELEAKGISLDSWIVSMLSISTELPKPEPASEFPEDLIGSIDSTEDPAHISEKTAFGDALKAKFEKQGLRFP